MILKILVPAFLTLKLSCKEIIENDVDSLLEHFYILQFITYKERRSF